MSTLFSSLDTAAEIWTAFWLATILSGAMFAFTGWLIWKIVDYFRTWFIWWDEDAGKVQIERRKVKGATITMGNSKDGRAYFLNARARKAANKGSAYVIDVHSGMNLTGPSRNEVNAIIEQFAKEPKESLNGHAKPSARELVLGVTEDAKKAAYEAERLAKVMVQKLKACDPFFAFNMLKTNSYKKFFRSAEGEEDWRTKWAIPAMIVAIMAILGIMWLANAYSKTKTGG